MSEVDGLKPLCDETEFAALLETMVVTSAPRVFAVVQEFGERLDGWVAGWGFAFEDRAEVFSVHDHSRMSLGKPENALHLFSSARNQLTARLVWLPDVGERPDVSEVATCSV
ncbi:hypothetical protein FHX81_4670 [Saccharothrix saharensis]|uniref:Uncharacterized protein n=1 Tax=Saccharothrix saharensis TaxID=571190 RepID=A0A543JHL8_9PSEU|nr:hypothetical protein [Saccharothrix saharensis]TQM82271.1 hypothetical protein FHX81_4670 [Saccharothrix saharensis]